MQRLNPGCLDVTAKLGLFLITRSKINVKTNTVLIRHEMCPSDSFKIVWENEVFFVGGHLQKIQLPPSESLLKVQIKWLSISFYIYLTSSKKKKA